MNSPEIRFNDNTIPTPLKQLSAHTSHKMLGIYNNPDGNTTAAFRVLKEKNATHTKMLDFHVRPVRKRNVGARFAKLLVIEL